MLWSWAVRKGPSLDPADKRIAAHVEDHPLDYADFQGTIPDGQYGAGKVETWDRGTWEPLADPEAGMRKGDLTFVLHGARLSGRFHLVRMKPKPGARSRQDAWLLFKGHDASERAGADAADDRSREAPPQRPRRVPTARRRRARNAASCRAPRPRSFVPPPRRRRRARTGSARSSSTATASWSSSRRARSVCSLAMVSTGPSVCLPSPAPSPRCVSARHCWTPNSSRCAPMASPAFPNCKPHCRPAGTTRSSCTSSTCCT